MVTAVCKMSRKAVTWPCSAAGCPLFGDCLAEYEKVLHAVTPKPMTNEQWLKGLPKGDLASTIHAFHLGYSPWCVHHCENEGDDGCDNCIAKWLELSATDDGEPSAVPQMEPTGKEITTRKHLSQVKRDETILYMDRHYVACHDAKQDMSHPRKEWWVEAKCKEDNLYESLYENAFLDGLAIIVVGETEAE